MYNKVANLELHFTKNFLFTIVFLNSNFNNYNLAPDLRQGKYVCGVDGFLWKGPPTGVEQWIKWEYNYPLSYGVPVRERYGSTLLPATREQHDQNCTQSH